MPPKNNQELAVSTTTQPQQQQPQKKSRFAFFVFLCSVFLPALLPLTALLFEIHYPEFHSPLNRGDRKRRTNAFCNFDRTHCCNATSLTSPKVLKPTTVEEVQEIVAEEYKSLQKIQKTHSSLNSGLGVKPVTPLIRVVGAGHSMSPIVCTSPDTNYPPRETILMTLDELHTTTAAADPTLSSSSENTNPSSSQQQQQSSRIKVVKKFDGAATRAHTKSSKLTSPTFLPPSSPAALVWASGGMRLKQLNEKLWDLGFSLYNTGMIQEQSIGGVIATAVHGTGYYNKPINHHVVEMDVVLANGTVAKFSKSSHSAIFKHSRMHLGLFGVIVGVTFEVRERFYVLRHEQMLNEAAFVDSILLNEAAIKERQVMAKITHGGMHNNDNDLSSSSSTPPLRTRTQAWWFQNDNALVQDMSPEYSVEQVENSEELNSLLQPSWLRPLESLITDAMYLILTTLSVQLPKTTPIIHKLALFNHGVERKMMMKSYEAFTHPGINYHSVRYSETEIFVPADEAVEVFEVYKKFIKEHTDTKSVCNINSLNPLRTVAADDIPMSPTFFVSPSSSNENVSHYLAVSFTMVYRDSFTKCATMLQKLLMKDSSSSSHHQTSFGGRPHWGKWFSPKLLKHRSDTERLYGKENVKEFSDAVKSVDPRGLFRPMFFENLFFSSVSPVDDEENVDYLN